MSKHETEVRDEAAIRTALMLGAEFSKTTNDLLRWKVKGINFAGTKAGVAWLFIATHGICIDKHGRAVKCSEIHHEDLP